MPKLLIECMILLKCVVSIASITFGVVCSFRQSDCIVSPNIASRLIGAGIAFIIAGSFTFMVHSIWFMFNKNSKYKTPNVMKILGVLSLQILPLIAFFVAGIIEANQGNQIGFAYMGAAGSIYVNFISSCIELWLILPKGALFKIESGMI